MNPLSAHPPRTPKTSVNTSSSMPFGSHADAIKVDAEDRATEPDGELDDDDEGAQEKSPAKNQIQAQDVWRELFTTSGGRDKALVLHFTTSATTPTD